MIQGVADFVLLSITGRAIARDDPVPREVYPMESGARDDGTAWPRCPTCRESIASDAFYCPGCKTPYHPVCLKGEGCLVAGCTGRPAGAETTTAEPYSPLWPAVYRCWAVGALAMVAAFVLLQDRQTYRVADVMAKLVVLGVLAFTSGTLVHDLMIRPSRRDRFGTAALASLFAIGPVSTLLLFLHRPAPEIVEMLGAGGFVLFVFLGMALDSEKRRASRSFELLIVLGIIGVMVAISDPGFRASLERANTRACYANQKTIAGALEMYSLDKGTKMTTMNPAMLNLLKSGGYLGSTPNDPGQGTGSSGNYHWTAGGNGIRCDTHGSIQ